MMDNIADIIEKELKMIGFKVDLVPEGFFIGGMFLMGGITFMHIRNKYCIPVRWEDDISNFPVC